MNADIKKRLKWVRLYKQTGDAGFVCRRCGISRPTLRKWWRRYQALGEAGLSNHSRRPKHSPNRKVFEPEERRILELRHTRHLGVGRIQHELKRLHDCDLGLATIQKVLNQHHVPPLKRERRAQRRVHGSLGKTPMERCCELIEKTPFQEAISVAFDEERERELQRTRR